MKGMKKLKENKEVSEVIDEELDEELEELPEVMSFKDEKGNKVDFEPIAKIYLEDTKYLILAPVGGNEEDAYVFRVDLEDGKDVLNLVEDEREFQSVKKQYKNLLYNEK